MKRVDDMVVPRLGNVLQRLAEGRLRPRLFTALALSIVVAGLVTAVWAVQRPMAEQVLTVRIGVAQGQTVDEYVAGSRSKLDDMLGQAFTIQGETYALVTLNSYLPPERLTPVLGGVSVAEVFGRVPGTQARIVRIPAFRIPDDVGPGMQAVATRRDQDAEQYRRLAAKLSTTEPQEADLRVKYLRGAAWATAEAVAYRNGCACVYAAVVRATPAALDQIAARPEVRAVDPAPALRRLDRATFAPPLPDKQATDIESSR